MSAKKKTSRKVISITRFIRESKTAFLFWAAGFLILAGGIGGYAVIEGYSFIDGLYMTIITISTVGFREVRELSQGGRLFTILMILVGIVYIGMLTRTLVELFAERLLNRTHVDSKMRRRIENLSDHYIICGYGRVGQAAARQFLKKEVPFVLIDASADKVEAARSQDIPSIQHDATDEDALKRVGISRCKGLLAVLPSDPDNLFLVLTARELSPIIHIIARSESTASEKKMIRAGADSVILPQESAGVILANDMLSATAPNRREATKSVIRPSWIAIRPGSSMVGQSIESIENDMEREIIGLRRGNIDTLNPSKEVTLQRGDRLLVLDDSTEDPEGTVLADRQAAKVLIADDNPVVLKLFTRLFARSGFVPITAEDGRTVLQIAEDERPDAIVADCKLPGMSGPELCKNLRKHKATEKARIIMFSADASPSDRKQALEAGADAFVHKGNNALSLIDETKKLLEEPPN